MQYLVLELVLLPPHCEDGDANGRTEDEWHDNGILLFEARDLHTRCSKQEVGSVHWAKSTGRM